MNTLDVEIQEIKDKMSLDEDITPTLATYRTAIERLEKEKGLLATVLEDREHIRTAMNCLEEQIEDITDRLKWHNEEKPIELDGLFYVKERERLQEILAQLEADKMVLQEATRHVPPASPDTEPSPVFDEPMAEGHETVGELPVHNTDRRWGELQLLPEQRPTIRCVGKAMDDTREPIEYMSASDVVVAEDMLSEEHGYVFYSAKELARRKAPALDKSQELLDRLKKDMIRSWKVDEKATLPENRELEITVINALKAVSYAQEVHLELDKIITLEILEQRTCHQVVNIYQLRQAMLRPELRDSFREPELSWLTPDHQAHAVHFTEKSMSRRIERIVASIQGPIVLTNTIKDPYKCPVLPHPPPGMGWHDFEGVPRFHNRFLYSKKLNETVIGDVSGKNFQNLALTKTPVVDSEVIKLTFKQTESRILGGALGHSERGRFLMKGNRGVQKKTGARFKRTIDI